MKPGDRLIVALVEPQAVGFRFNEWPLHVTIVPWFRLLDETATITAGLTNALSAIQPFEAAGDKTAMFGPRKNRPATLIAQPTPFTIVEQKARNYLHQKRAWLVDETTKRRHAFRPHVTARAESKLVPGKIFACDRLYIVEQMGNYKEVVGEIELSEQ